MVGSHVSYRSLSIEKLCCPLSRFQDSGLSIVSTMPSTHVTICITTLFHSLMLSDVHKVSSLHTDPPHVGYVRICHISIHLVLNVRIMWRAGRISCRAARSILVASLVRLPLAAYPIRADSASRHTFLGPPRVISTANFESRCTNSTNATCVIGRSSTWRNARRGTVRPWSMGNWGECG